MTKPAKPAKTPAPYVPDENDIVADTLAAVLEIWPDLNADQIRSVEQQVFARWEGDTYYCKRRSSERRSARNDAILRDHHAGERIPLLARRYGLTERRIMQIVQPAA